VSELDRSGDRPVPGADPIPGADPVPGGGRTATAVHGAIAATGALLWAVSPRAVDLSAMSGWGLLPGLPWTWYLSLACVVPYLVAAVGGRCRTGVLALYQAVLIAVLFATTSATYATPRFSWTYKHIGVTEHLLATGQLDRSIDIYNNWPGMFLLSAAITRTTGVSTMTLAQWSEPFFAAVISASLVFAVRGLTRDRRVVWVTLLVFTLSNWIAQNYYSPQAIAFALSLLFLGCVLRWMPLRDGAGRPLIRPALTRRLPPSWRDLAPPPLGASGDGPVWPLAATVLFALIVVTHQLTPVALLLQIGLLAVTLRVRSPWILGVWAVVEGAWVSLAWQLIVHRFGILDPGFTTPGLDEAAFEGVLPGMDVVPYTPLLLVAAIGAAALGSLLTRLATGVLDLVTLCLAVAPWAFLAVQTYGGEGVFRAYLFSLTWLSVLVALLVVTCWRRALIPLVAVATAAVTALAVPAMLGSELLDTVPGTEIEASRWFETRTPPGSYTVTLTGSGEFPLLLTGEYPRHITPSVVITQSPAFLPGRSDASAVLALAEEILADEGPHAYLAITGRQLALATMGGQLRPAEAKRLLLAVRTSPRLDVVYDTGGDVIARWRQEPRRRT
jgi:hypothetical protein